VAKDEHNDVEGSGSATGYWKLHVKATYVRVWPNITRTTFYR